MPQTQVMKLLAWLGLSKSYLFGSLGLIVPAFMYVLSFHLTQASSPMHDLDEERRMLVEEPVLDLEEERRTLVEERLELDQMKRQFMKDKAEGEEEVKHKKHHRNYQKLPKTQFERDFETKWKQRFGESYRH